MCVGRWGVGARVGVETGGSSSRLWMVVPTLSCGC